MSARGTPLGAIEVPDVDAAIVAAARPTLRPIGQSNLWVPSPSNPYAVAATGRDVKRLVPAGKLKFGNRSRTFVVPVQGTRS